MIDPLTAGAVISTVASLAQGFAQGGKAKKLRKQYDAAEGAIPMQDPMQVSQLAEIGREKRAYQAGTDPMTAYSRQAAGNLTQQTQTNQLRAGITGTGELLRAQAVGNNAYAAAGARAPGIALQLQGMEGELVNSMANRAYTRQLSRVNRIWSEYGAMKEGSQGAFQAALASVPGLSANFGKRRSGGFDPGQLGPMEGDTRYGPNETYRIDPVNTLPPVANPLSYVPIQ